MDLRGVGPVFGGLGDVLELTGLGVITDRQTQAYGFEVVAQDFFFLGRRAFVHAEQAEMLALRYEVGAANIGCEHGFFNQAVRHVAGAGNDFFNPAVVVTDDLGLGGLEVHRTAFLARGQQRLVHSVQVQQMRQHGFAAGGFGAACVAQNGGDFRVRQARLAPHDCRIKLVGLHLAVHADEHIADHAQALDLGVERAQAVGEFFRQHGNHAAREIHAGGPVIGVDINRRTVFHIVAHIGNRDQQTPAFDRAFATAFADRLAVHGVVKITRIFTVNGDQGNIRQINPIGPVLLADLVRQSAGQRQTGGRKLVRNTVFTHRNFDLHPRIVHLAQHLLDATDRLTKKRWRLHQFNHYHLADPGHTGGALRDQNILTVALIFGRDQPDAAFVQQAANNGLTGAFNDFHDPSFGTAFAVAAHDACLDAVFVQHGAHLIRWQINVGRTVVARNKAVAITVTKDYAFDFIQGVKGCGGGFDTISLFPESPGGGIGRRTSFRY